jgi:hypothetical protein
MDVCSGGCDDFNDWGKFRRFRIAHEPEQYSASVERQDVVRQGTLGIESLTRDLGFKCAVRSPHDWQCEHELVDPKRLEKYSMTGGMLTYFLENPNWFLPNAGLGPDWGYVPYCTWKQVQVHNHASRHDDDFTSGVVQLPGRFAFSWYILTGCDSSLPVPWGYFALERLPPWMAVLVVGLG